MSDLCGDLEIVLPCIPEIVAELPGSTLNVLPVPGPKGLKGDPGVPGNVRALDYRHSQLSTANTWTINHNLGFNPSGVIVHNSAGRITEFDNISWPDENTVVITFYPGRAVSGYADLS